MIRILLVDDQPAIRKGLRMRLLLESDMTVVAEAADGHDALTQAAAHTPDVVVMDVALPGLDGISATSELLRRGASCSVIVLTLHDDAVTRAKASAAGARAFVAKQEGDAQLLAAIREVAAQRAID